MDMPREPIDVLGEVGDVAAVYAEFLGNANLRPAASFPQFSQSRSESDTEFISKDGNAHAVYYALLNVEDERPRVGLALSVGPWWDGTDPSQRSWVHLNVWSEAGETHMGIRDPAESNSYPWEKGGLPLTREPAKLSSAIQEIWQVADFIVDTDRAVSSYLDGSGVDMVGREIRQADHPARNC
jgi:hypothetical protein